MQQQIKVLEAVEATLEKVTVCGAENWNRMLGCIGALRGVRAELEKKEKEMANNAEGSADAARERDPEDAAGAV